MAVIDLNDSTPAAPAGKKNVKWQADAAGSDPRHTSAYVPNFTGDSGSGGVGGGVPAPAAGDAAGGKFLAADGTWNVPGGVGTQPYDAYLFVPGVLVTASLLMLRVIPVRAVSFPSGMTLSTATASAAATGSTVFSVKKNGTQFATITYGAGSASGTFAAASSTSFNGTSDVLSVVGPSSNDATLADVGIGLAGTR